MRLQRSSTHDQKAEQDIAWHRVIIPLYIPHEADYYKDSFKIFKACVQSLQKTTSTQTRVSVIANGCSQSIHEQLLALVAQGLIEELIVETSQLGKINSLRKVIGASDEPYLTITDGDVMFLQGWEQAVQKVFTSIPRATAVAPVPIFKTFNQYATNIWAENLWNGKVQFEAPSSPDDLERFANSIGWSYLNDYQKETILTYTNNGLKTVVGCSHFCTTYKKEALELAPDHPSEFLLSGNSEAVYLDEPTVKNNGYRLSTYTNHAYHLGNIWEDWMDDELEALKQEEAALSWPAYKDISPSNFRYWLNFKLLKKLFKKPKCYNYALKRFGIPEQFKNHYLK